MSNLPEEIYNDILLRLPVKSLLRCKSVCKNWYALISSSNFIKTHITIQKIHSPMLMVESLGNNQLYSMGCDSLESVCNFKSDVNRMDYPFKSFGYKVGLFGSSNGLVCLILFTEDDDYDSGSDGGSSSRGSGSDSDSDGDDDGHRGIFCIWNPATREYKILPESPIGFTGNDIRAFGFDHKTDDYKVIASVKTGASSSLIKVYTLASNSWETRKTIPYRFLYNIQHSGVLVNRDLHWLAKSQDYLLILSLDISGETFKEIELPKELSKKSNDKDMILGVLEGCLCVLVSLRAELFPVQFDVWEMVHSGVRESWTKRYAIADEYIIDVGSYIRFVMCFKNGAILFFLSCGPVLYDPKSGSSRILKIDKFSFWRAEKYAESLVSLNSGTSAGEEKATEKSTET